MPPQAGQPPVQGSQVVIDLTLSDDEDTSTTQQQLSNHLEHAANLLQEVPAMHHGMPMFVPSADHKSERRDGASGANYAETPLQRSLWHPASAAPNHSRARSGSNLTGRANHRKSIRPSVSLEGPSNRRALRSGIQNLPNIAKRRKLNHVSLEGQDTGASTGSLGTIPPPSTTQRTSQFVNLTPPPTVTGRTVITGESRVLSSYGLSHVPEQGIVQKSGPLDKQNIDLPILRGVLKVISSSLKPHEDLSSADRNAIAGKTAAYLFGPELKADYESNNGHLSKEYERTIATEAKAYVDSYVETMKELKGKAITSSKKTILSLDIRSRYGGTEESEGSSSSSAADDIFEQRSAFQHPGSSAALSRSYSESPTTELSNDPIDSVGAQDFNGSGKAQANHVSVNTTHSLRRSERAATQGSLPSYVLGNKRRRRNAPSDNAADGPAVGNVETLPMDVDCEDDIRDELKGLKAIARSIPPPPKEPDIPPSDGLMLSLLRQREMGMAPARVASGRTSFKATIYAKLEDSFVQQSEWTDCSGDIASITWITEDAFLCGALAHLDSHNMQYNKPGNLLLGSTTKDTLRSFGDHRVARPLVDKAQNVENALDSMRRTQDPWIYSSVVSTAHCKKNGFSFTASFDETVKIWSIHKDGSSMDLVGTWNHQGKVNFVVTSDHHERVATASEVKSNAVRVYNFDKASISDSAYDLYYGDKAFEQIENIPRRDGWSYQPATIQWGKGLEVKDLLLVGYSPRSDTGDDNDIPYDKKNTGELCVWNVVTGAPMVISAAHTQNVFEVQWHPTQPIFVAATSPCGHFDADKTKTQIRVFALRYDKDTKEYTNIFQVKHSLDCPALDINELTVMANSLPHSYVTASCTDGNTYVYDTKQGDQAIHILQHGDSLETLAHDLPREIGDTGVTFAAWGQTTNRFYTGSSDGTVKAWNIKALAGKAFVRNVLTLDGGIATGAFSKDFSKLIIGDATGKVYLMSVDDSDVQGGPVSTKLGRNSIESAPPESASSKTATAKSASGNSTVAKTTLQLLLEQKNGLLPVTIKRPKIIIPHPDPSPPAGSDVSIVKEQTSVDIAQHYLNEGFLEQHVGLGVYQGPNYAETGWFETEAHVERDPSRPLLPEFQAEQQYTMRQLNIETKFERLPQVKSSNLKKHEENTKLDLIFDQLSPETRNSLIKDRVEYAGDFTDSLPYDLPPRFSIFNSYKKKTRSEASTSKTQDRSMRDAEESME